jgi:hypothetical protein
MRVGDPLLAVDDVPVRPLHKSRWVKSFFFLLISFSLPPSLPPSFPPLGEIHACRPPSPLPARATSDPPPHPCA